MVLIFLFFLSKSFEMNPLCCIAPVSIDKDRGNPVLVKAQTQSLSKLGLDTSVKATNVSLKPQVSLVVHEANASGNDDVKDNVSEAIDSKVCSGSGGVGNASVAGILCKWVNCGKGWRSRWFVLEDGVLSYYKIHGLDKIVMSPGREKGVMVIGEESLRYMKKANSSNYRLGVGFAKQWKPFSVIHLELPT